MSENGQSYDNEHIETAKVPVKEAPLQEVSWEEMYDSLEGAEADLAIEELIDTAHSDGHTYNPHLAQQQGLTYTPPTDPPVLPGNDLQGAQIAAGFATSMEDSDPNPERLPSQVANGDLNLEDVAYSALRNNSETSHLDLNEIDIRVRNGVAFVKGEVFSEDDAAIIDRIIANLDGIDEVELNVSIAGLTE